MKKVQLERTLQSLDPIADPTAASEQCPTPAGIAAELVYFAAGRGDIEGRSVVDLGCGNGILAIAAKLLGAGRVLGIDSDSKALAVAGRNSARAGVEVEWVRRTVDGFHEPFDTVVMNPPFGAQTRKADRPFLDAAIASGRVAYTFLNPASEEFVRRRIEASGGSITDRLEYAFPIAHLFPFHRDELRTIAVLLFRFEVAKD